MIRFPIANIARSADVRRWHTTPSYKAPSIAEHTCLVAHYSLYLLTGIVEQPTAEQELKILKLALWHDMSETITGDVPTPLKRYLESLFPAGQSPLEKLEERLCEPYAIAKEDADGLSKIIMKLADVLDAAHFAQNEIKARASKAIFDERKAAYASYVAKGEAEYPDYNWHYAHELLEDLMTSEPVSIAFTELMAHDATPELLNSPAVQWETKKKGSSDATTWALIRELGSRIFRF
ncbi:HD domain-containing protein [Pseudomonas fluorescens]|uniref:YfbR-like 5'-deoxynucleotidase n=1 Tax=Pseudomonas TaxID=286 RepID=UPI000F036825|nr:MULTISPECIES: YfbR-like 5'-deoxynucleotidase [Pseudomonas]MBD8089379.1 HD domain-containing protein [Pseudomonas fluorescens]MBD8615194.1 HD domain-containing protein [Pseudomonas putida]MBD8682152.1 HD domain-containing protein [Pseudomonas sp. CFBP 13719]